ncbi:hypothetical protein [Phaeobacter gallaeciensis]|uniref:hypothetical protein n=1 Tax=Phaeobacter gallaeciensis TaxID=60890 RepID=UPI00237FAEA9|nr:hypothetical protein [Phaeobacter gallaeciensis]MDE4189682.1 hypothetical protein [Phaeobacter gallaeciensis]MDE4198834.1 hypothetical protein [Phaeobacter gallaeciensis]MDE4202982.1 hypothetical protein [Phaeobacter gallaeciensis]MDE4207124.1 hypothetical protein [Phaeobacter gallaeciensis]MDE4215652.1 hypothetical protein [Phaeobacter gallaeciensis]
MGLGDGLMKVADDRRKLADDLLKMEKKAELDKDVAESRAASKARHRKGGSGSGSSGGRSGRALSNTESDNLARLYKDYAENGAFEGEAPGLGAFETRVEQLIKEEGSLAKAAERARGEWGSTEVTTTELKERHPLSPARLWDDDGKYEETSTQTNYGFRSALGGPPAPDAGQGQKPDTSQAIADAKDAIARGADPEKVKQRLREMGIEPKGL